MEQWLASLQTWAQVGIFAGLLGIIFGTLAVMDNGCDLDDILAIPILAGVFIFFAEAVYGLFVIMGIWIN